MVVVPETRQIPKEVLFDRLVSFVGKSTDQLIG